MGVRMGAAALLGVLSFTAYCPPAQGGAEVGSEVSVREGDVWTKVKVIAVEGHKLQVRYDDGTEEWVGPDRLQAATGSPAAPGDSTKEAKPAVHAFSAGQAVEVKRMGRWLPAHVRQIGKGWIFVAEDQERGEMRWIEPWAVRVPGSSYDLEGWGTRSWAAQPGQIQPRQQPERAPEHRGDPFEVLPESERPLTLEDLHTQFEVVSFDGSHPPVATTPPATAPTTRPAPVFNEFSAWALRGVETDFSDILPCTDGDKIAIAAFAGGSGKSTVVIRTRLASHTQMDTRSLLLPDVKVIAAAREGDLLLSMCDGDKKLQVWEWSDRAYKLTANLQVDPTDRSNILSAAFVSPDKVVVQAKDWLAPYRTIYLVDLEHKQVISTVKAAKDSEMFVHPGGEVVGVMSSSSTALLLRASDFGVIAEYPDAGLASNVSIDPTGQWAAYLTTSGVVRIVKIADGSKLGVVAVGSAFKGRLDLVDDKFLLVDHTTVYSVESGIPVWTYKMPRQVHVKPLANGQFIIAMAGNRMASVAVASIPDQVGRTALKTASPDRFMLKPGTPIKIDADYSRFGEDKEKAAAAIEGMLRSAGMTVSDKDEAFHLAISITAGPTEKRDYAPGMFSHSPDRGITTVNVPSTILTTTLNHKGQACWKQELRFMAGGSISRDEQHTYQDYANAAAQPNAEALKGLIFPSYLPTDAKPGEPAALGASALQDRRFVPEHPLTPARGARKH